MAPSDLNLEAQIWKLWEWDFFVTANNFANGPHFVALTQLRATKTGSKICCTHLSYTYSESWVRKDSVGTCPEKFSRPKFSGTERFTKKFHFSLISLAASKKKVSGSCTHNFDATDLPNSSFEPLYPKLFRGTPEVDLVPIVWHTAPPKVRIPRIHCRQKRLFLGVFLEKKKFSWQNGRLSPIACLTDSESYWSRG